MSALGFVVEGFDAGGLEPIVELAAGGGFTFVLDASRPFSGVEGRLRALESAGRAALCTTTATNAPLAHLDRAALRAQVRVAVDRHAQRFGEKPQGIRLVGYQPPMDELLAEQGLRWALVEGVAFDGASAPLARGRYAPIHCPRTGVAAFALDPESGKRPAKGEAGEAFAKARLAQGAWLSKRLGEAPYMLCRLPAWPGAGAFLCQALPALGELRLCTPPAWLSEHSVNQAAWPGPFGALSPHPWLYRHLSAALEALLALADRPSSPRLAEAARSLLLAQDPRIDALKARAHLEAVHALCAAEASGAAATELLAERAEVDPDFPAVDHRVYLRA